MNRKSMIGALAILALVLAFAVAGCGGGVEDAAIVPDCHPKTEKCRETSDGFVIPVWYWLVLMNQQGTRNVSIEGEHLPTVADEEAAGAPEAKVEASETTESQNEQALPSEEQVAPEESFSPPEESTPSAPPAESAPTESFGGEE